MINNPTPRYYKIYRLLKQALENRDFASDEALPGENALAEKYQVSRLTIRRSLELLQREGLIERRQGSGTYPTVSSVKVQPLPADINKLLAHLNKMGATTEAKLLSFAYEMPNPDVQNRLELAANTAVQKAIRVRYYEGAPFSYLITYVPEHLGRRYTEEDLMRHPLQALFKKSGMRAAAAEQSLTATLADTQHADALAVEVGSPLLCIRRVVRDAGNRPMEYLIAAYNPARFEYRMTMSNKRSKGEDAWIMDDSH
ncbi:GntR family transcriptional regulator [Pollutimonas bauzanensis]|uniref:GntR family transcriptional regulator n=1 Tax=Pollutimonas bauzanensis TaxID=658167 RepID=A0A1M5YGB1_9BURK|nr:GntR family transcriptional regulator [Pollutimonas bauzanensis]SHI11002.1 GntR family transcriptional regulator [Pollutimonas bauzanensis]